MAVSDLVPRVPAVLAEKGQSLIPLFEQQQHDHPLNFHGVQSSLSHFTNGWFVLSLLLGLVVAALCGFAIAWHPRRSGKGDPVEDLEQCNTLIVLALVGAVVSELVRVDSAMALVIFGIGGLIRFRTVLENPKITGKAILVVLIGLACGLGQFATAIFVTAFAWGLVMWLESHMSARLKVRVNEKTNLREAYAAMLDFLHARRCRVKSSMMVEGKHQVAALIHFPAGLDPKAMEADLKGALPRAGDGCDVEVEVE